MKTLSPSTLAALAGPKLTVAMLVHLDLLPTPVRLNTSGWNLAWGGHTWEGLGTLGRIEPLEDQPGELRGARIELSGVPSSLVALALGEPVQGRPITIRTALFDPATYQVLEAPVEWVGLLDGLPLADGRQAATIRLTAEHVGIDLLRSNTLRYTDADQQRLYPGDRGLSFVVDQVDQPIVWPARAFFKQ